MKSDFEFLSARLRALEPLTRCYMRHNNLKSTSRVEVVSQLPLAGEPEALYLIRSSQLPAVPPSLQPCNLLCVEDLPVPTWLSKLPDCSVIVLPATVSEEYIRKITQEIHNAQHKFSTALSSIIESLYFGRGLQAIADSAAELFHNPVMILDSGLGALAISRTIPIQRESIKRNLVQGYLHDEIIRFLKVVNWPNSQSNGENYIHFPYELCSQYLEGPPPYGWYCCYVKVNGVTISYISIFCENEPILDYHLDWINQLCHITSIEIQKRQDLLINQGSAYELLLTDLLEKRITDRLVVLRRIELLKRKIEKYLYVVSIRKNNPSGSQTFSAVEQKSLRTMFPGSISVGYHGDAVLLISSADGTFPTADGIASLDQRLSNSGLIAGVSLSFTDIMDLRRYYLQSTKALELGKYIFSSGGFHRYSDYTVYHALQLCIEKVDLRDLCHPGILRLQESSDPGDNDLLQTLYLYLLYMKDVKRVSEALGIHRSTLFYRLNKIKDITGVSLDDGNTVFQLMFSFKLIEFMDSFTPGSIQTKHREFKFPAR